MKKLISSLFKSKTSKLLVVLGLFAMGYLQNKGLLNFITTVSSGLVTPSVADMQEPLPQYEAAKPETVTNESPSSCQVFPATAEVNSDLDLYMEKVQRLQQGYLDQTASNPFQACAKSAAALGARSKLPTVGFPNEICRNNHQKQVTALQNTKSLYYERYLALSKEPACASLLSATESSVQQPQQIAMAQDMTSIPSGYEARGVK